MSDVDRVIRARAAKSPRFHAMVEKELAELRVGLIIKELRQKSGMTQEELARRLKTTKSAVSRLENRSGGARLETLEKIAQAFGKELVIEFR
jgi:ribosome-binding protein aMBF1 (putative translation factor)